MRITRIELQNFRNHIDTSVDWAPHLNVLTGPNGVGKTNLIDAIHYLCMSRSFVTNSDMYVVHQGDSFFKISGTFEGSIRKEFKVSCSYSRGDGKKIFVNDSPLERLSELIGMIPVVVLSPVDKKLTSEGPSERRSFLDSLISQISKAYLRDLIDYRKIIRQRNRLLSEYKMPDQVMKSYLEPWNIQLIETGARIVAKRTEVLNEYRSFLEEAYSRISNIKHKPHFEYKTFCEPSSDPKTVEEQYRQVIEDSFDKERDVEYTTVGPHRDDIVFYLDDFELRKFGSQGQHRLFAISLKLAQLFFFSEYLDDLPILLLDDVFGDLDPHKTEVLLQMLANHEGQTFITSANPLAFNQFVDFSNSSNKHLQFDRGEIINQI